MAEIDADAAHYANVNAVNAAAMVLGEIEPFRLCEMKTGRWHMLEPAADITPHEAAHVAIFLFRCLAANAQSKPLDWMAYVEKHGLARHFKP